MGLATELVDKGSVGWLMLEFGLGVVLPLCNMTFTQWQGVFYGLIGVLSLVFMAMLKL